MPDNGGKVVINLATGLEDPERVTVAFLVGDAAAEQGKRVAMFLTKEAVRIATAGFADFVACDGCPPLARLFEQYAEHGVPRPARSAKATWPETLASPARHRSGSGSATNPRPSSATSEPGSAQTMSAIANFLLADRDQRRRVRAWPSR